MTSVLPQCSVVDGDQLYRVRHQSWRHRTDLPPMSKATVQQSSWTR